MLFVRQMIKKCLVIITLFKISVMIYASKELTEEVTISKMEIVKVHLFTKGKI